MVTRATSLACICWVVFHTFAAALVAGRTSQANDVVLKVIEMLEDNLAKVKADLDASSKEMAEYSELCDSEATEKAFAIKAATRKIDSLSAKIVDQKANIKLLDDEISFVGTSMAAKQRDLSTATALHEKQKSDFLAEEQQLQGAVDTLVKAVTLVKSGQRSNVGLLQTGRKPAPGFALDPRIISSLRSVVTAAWVDEGSATALKGFLQENQTDNSVVGQDSASGGGVLDTLVDMKEKAQTTLSKLQADGAKHTHSFQMMSQSLVDALKLGEQKLFTAKKRRSAAKQVLGASNGELAEWDKSKVSDLSSLEKLRHECKDAADTWQMRQKTANDEIAALDKAKDILSNRVKTLFQFNDPDDEGVAHSDDSRSAAARQRLIGRLKTLSQHVHNFAMMELISAAGSDPLDNVRGLVSNMIAKLMLEENHEATQKSFCDDEKTKSTQAQDHKRMRLEELHSRRDIAAAARSELFKGTRVLQSEVAELKKAAAEATRIRQGEHATFVQSSKDFKDGATSTQQAIGILREFYDSSGASLVQSGKESPAGRLLQLRSASKAASSMVISILENSCAEFTKMYMEAESEEREAFAAYEQAMSNNEAAVAAKEATLKGAASEIKSLDVTLANSDEDSQMTEKELDAVTAYIEKLKPQCQVEVDSYEEQKEERNTQIEGLQEALRIISVEESLVQTGSDRIRSFHSLNLDM